MDTGWKEWSDHQAVQPDQPDTPSEPDVPDEPDTPSEPEDPSEPDDPGISDGPTKEELAKEIQEKEERLKELELEQRTAELELKQLKKKGRQCDRNQYSGRNRKIGDG